MGTVNEKGNFFGPSRIDPARDFKREVEKPSLRIL
jgi:hypothetical protein